MGTNKPNADGDGVFQGFGKGQSKSIFRPPKGLGEVVRGIPVVQTTITAPTGHEAIPPIPLPAYAPANELVWRLQAFLRGEPDPTEDFQGGVPDVKDPKEAAKIASSLGMTDQDQMKETLAALGLSKGSVSDQLDFGQGPPTVSKSFDPQLTSGAADAVSASFGIDYDLMAEAVQKGMTASNAQATGGTSEPTTGRSAVPSTKTKGKTSAQVASEGHVKAPDISLRGLVSRMSNSAGLAISGAGKGRHPNVANINGQWYRGPKTGETLPEVPDSTFGPGVAISAEEAASSGGVLDALGGAIGGIGSGGMLAGLGGAGALGGAAALGLGIVGGGYEAAMHLGSFVSGQRQQNAFYQGMLGGTNASGLGQRIEGMGFRFSQLGNLSGAQANALFQGTTSMDMTGTQRENAMSTAIKLYNQLGVSIQASLQDISTAAQSGNKELTGLAQAITTVTAAAVAGGVNANVARSNFSNVYQATTQTIQGPGATAVASGISSMQAGLGQQFQGTDFSGLTSQNTMMLLANSMGMDYGKFVGQIEQGNTSLYGKALSSRLGQLSSSLNVGQLIAQAAKSPGMASVAKALKGGKETEAQAQSDVNDLAAQIQANGSNIGLVAAPALNGLLGTNMTPALALDFLIAQSTGSLNVQTPSTNYQTGTMKRIPGSPGGAITSTNYQTQAKAYANTYKQAAAAYDKAATTGMYDGKKVTLQVLNRLRGAMNDAQGTMTQYTPQGAVETGSQGKTFQTEESNIGLTPGTEIPVGPVGGGGTGTQASEWYMQNIWGKGKKDPAMESILANASLNNSQTMFQVKLNNNKTGLVNVGQLQSNPDFLKQVQAGTVTVASSPDASYNNQTLAEIHPGTYTGDKNAGGTLTKAEQGQQAANQAAVNKAQANIITVVPSQNLLYWMQLNSNSPNIAIDGSTATNQTGASYQAPITTGATSGFTGA
jgi:hypothetical protein